MKILICPDKFKGSLTSPEAAAHIYHGIMNVIPDAECRQIPMADGGEGTVDALVRATQGNKTDVLVNDPLMRPVHAQYGISGDNLTAFIEMAEASGLALLAVDERNPMNTTTFGTGELIKNAINKGMRKIIIGIGGSATIDGGVGMAKALGVKFLDEKGNDTASGGRCLKEIRHIDVSLRDKRISECEIYAACDVRNTLTGRDGAARMFGKQKGASEYEIRELDEGLKNLCEIVKYDLNVDVSVLPGGGAAGGLGAGIVAFLNGRLQNGFELVAELAGLDEWIRWADLVITGEGKMDEQTAYGKTPAGVAKRAAAMNKPVIAFVGSVGESFNDHDNNLGFSAIIPIVDSPMSTEESMYNAGKLLRNASERTFRLISLYKA